MCGIAGIVLRDGFDQTLQVMDQSLERMAHSLHHRGPDERRLSRGARAGLSFARLSIIDVERGSQPMTSPDGSLRLAFNGEIYNFRELRKPLQALGRRFVTESDSEVLLAAYEAWGESCLERLNGMFAFAVQDERNGSVFLARDRLGIKPLYYAEGPAGLIFGSEIKALLSSGLVDSEIDPSAMDDYLSFGFVPEPHTFYRHIRQLPPGHCAIYSPREGLHIRRYWQVERRRELPKRLEDAADELVDLLSDAVRLRMVADVPLGALLSGGIDSGLVVSLLARHSDRPVRTFSVGFEEERFDELPWARRVAERYATDHTEIICRPDVHALVSQLASAFDQPFGDSSAVPTFLVCEEARRFVTVALSGDGGDEGFAGYARHMRFMRNRGRGNALRRRMARLLASAMEPSAKGAQRLRRIGLGSIEWQIDSITVAETRLRQRLLGAASVGGGGRSRAEESAWKSGGVFADEESLARFQHQDLTVYLPGDILEKVDRASMLNSLELRVPLLDHRVVEFGLSLPAEWKNDGIHGKLVLREIAKRLLPPEHLSKRKSGFSIPAADWLSGELRELMMDTLGCSRLASDGYLSQRYVRRLLDQHVGGRSRATLIWALLVAELWYRQRDS